MQNRIKELRSEKGLKQKDLSAIIKITQRRLSDIENNKADATGKTLEKIAKALDTTISYILYESKEKDRTNICTIERSAEHPEVNYYHQ